MCDMCDNRYKELQEKLDVANFNINAMSKCIEELEQNQLVLAECINTLEEHILCVEKQ